MRIRSIEVSGFRAFPRAISFDLDADAVIIAGPNGTGKTSLFDAFSWGLCGRLGRYGDRKEGLISLYSESGTARVALLLAKGDQELRITRSFDGHDEHLTVEDAGDFHEQEAAQQAIVRRLWLAGLTLPDPFSAFETVLTRSIYLQQDLVREFLERDSDAERFQVISELVGAGRIADFQSDLESSRNAWSRGRTELERRFRGAQTNLENIQIRLQRLAQDEAKSQVEDPRNAWFQWWGRANELSPLGDAPPFQPSRVTSLLADALQTLLTSRRSLERRLLDAKSFLSDYQARPTFTDTDDSGERALREQIQQLVRELDVTRSQLEELESRAAEQRRMFLEQGALREELEVLATLALRHLGGPCPVCGQEHDVKRTRERLEKLTKETSSEPTFSETEIAPLRQQISERERALATSQGRLRELQLRREQASQWEARAADWARELGINASEGDLPGKIQETIANWEASAQRLSELYGQGERLSLDLTHAAEESLRGELVAALAEAQRATKLAKEEFERHVEIGQVATTALEAAREAVGDAVADQVAAIDPLVERIYARIDPHPSFRQVHLLTRYYRGKGRLDTVVQDPASDLPEQDPFPVFSSSQLNALAVAVFLGLNLGVATVPIKTALLDDPLQSLDDVNLLGLVDALRRSKEHRQLLISTHDSRLGNLLEVKLRPVGEEQRTLVIEFAEWSARGPKVIVREVDKDIDELRVVA